MPRNGKDSSTLARNDVAVKIDAEIARKAKHVVINRRTSKRGLTLAEYLSALLKPLVERDYEAEFGHGQRRGKPEK